ncbi:DUF4468 domain-containing protein [Coprobacter tertius]|uniref:DUF4468 domain-containing protein n=1 Tax=Coprobacter tertius TaxID=2944915 RepID=A0ABT1MFK3_9BACT|nr:DUF4468 domain-containing protein [Coprobacter tertius]MCP9611418.1 DUF4468 domain-containing protein [Coprobacter tertius]
MKNKNSHNGTVPYIKLLLLLLAFSPVLAAAQKQEKDMSRYMAGAVPVKNGMIVFSKTFEVPGATEKQIYDEVLKWAQNRFSTPENNEDVNIQRVIQFANPQEGKIVAQAMEYIVFSKKILYIDRTTVKYLAIITCKPGQCTMEITNISYIYDQPNVLNKYKAEDWITDKKAIRKDKLWAIPGKFRVGTIDFVDSLFNELQTVLGIKPDAEKEKNVNKKPVLLDLKGYKAISPRNIPAAISRKMGEDAMIISTGESNRAEYVTGNWGGLGEILNSVVTYCNISPTLGINARMKENGTYTLSFYDKKDVAEAIVSGTEGSINKTVLPSGNISPEGASVIIECRKLAVQPQNDTELFIGEIINIWIKE